MMNMQEMPLLDNQLMLKDGQWFLKGAQCEKCQHIIFPVKMACPNCGSDCLVEISVGNAGTIKQFTISYVAPEGFHAPLVQAMVELPTGIVAFSLIDIQQNDLFSVRKGMKVQVAPVCSNHEITGWMFRPVLEGSYE